MPIPRERIERDVRIEQSMRGMEKRESGPFRRKPENMQEPWWMEREERIKEYRAKLLRGERLFERGLE